VRSDIASGRFAVGANLREGQLMRALGASRTPVRLACAQLVAEGILEPAAGRGFRVARKPEIPAALDQDGEADTSFLRLPGWQSVYNAIEGALIRHSAFGAWRVSELELSREMQVGRAITRDVLNRLEAIGILEKDARLRWRVVPMDVRRLHHLYEIRGLLEPAALRGACPGLSLGLLMPMREKLLRNIARYPDVLPEDMDDLENDLHVVCLSFAPNVDLVASLARTRSVLTLSKHVLGTSITLPPEEPFMLDHVEILNQLIAGEADGAAQALQTHLLRSEAKVADRLTEFRQSGPPDQPDYLRPVK
jgi:DNA-binding GntR family transcriptional regulator